MNSIEFNNIAICDFLYCHGHKPIRMVGNTLWYLSPLRQESTASFKVEIKKNTWYDFGLGAGGGLTKLIKLYFHTEDISPIQSNLYNIPHLCIDEIPRKNKTVFSVTKTTPGLSGKLLSYITNRGIKDESIINRYCQTVIFHNNTRSTNYYAIGFPNISGGYEIRNKYFKGAIPPKDITLVSSGNRTCTVFEGFMDFLSFLYMQQSQFDLGECDHLIMNSTANVVKSLQHLQIYDKVYSFMDNDKAGKDAYSTLSNSIHNIKDMSCLYASHKDLNEYLCTSIKQR